MNPASEDRGQTHLKQPVYSDIQHGILGFHSQYVTTFDHVFASTSLLGFSPQTLFSDVHKQPLPHQIHVIPAGGHKVRIVSCEGDKPEEKQKTT